MQNDWPLSRLSATAMPRAHRLLTALHVDDPTYAGLCMMVHNKTATVLRRVVPEWQLWHAASRPVRWLKVRPRRSCRLSCLARPRFILDRGSCAVPPWLLFMILRGRWSTLGQPVNAVLGTSRPDCARRNPVNHDELVRSVKGLPTKSLKLKGMPIAAACGS